jgi:hypothetical protein
MTIKAHGSICIDESETLNILKSSFQDVGCMTFEVINLSLTKLCLSNLYSTSSAENAELAKKRKLHASSHGQVGIKMNYLLQFNELYTLQLRDHHHRDDKSDSDSDSFRCKRIHQLHHCCFDCNPPPLLMIEAAFYSDHHKNCMYKRLMKLLSHMD